MLSESSLLSLKHVERQEKKLMSLTVKLAFGLFRVRIQLVGKVLLGGNEGRLEVDMLLAGRCRVEEKGGKTPGEAAGPELDSWNAPCFWVCQPGVVDEVCCCCCCWRRRSFMTCFSLKKKVKLIVK